MTSIQPEFDPEVFRFTARKAGYTDQEIDEYIRQKAPQQMGFFEKIKKDSDRQEARFAAGLFGSLANTSKRIGDIGSGMASTPLTNIPGAGLVGEIGKRASDFFQSKKPTIPEAPAGQGKLDRFADNVVGMAGTMAGEAPVYAALGIPIRAAAGAAAAAVPHSTSFAPAFARTLLTGSVPGSYFRSVAASTPINMIESVLTDMIVHPEDTMTKEGVVRSALLGSLGALGEGLTKGRAGPKLGPAEPDPLGDLLAGPRKPTSVSLTALADQEIFDSARPFKDMKEWQGPQSPYSLARRLVGVEDQIHLNQNEVKMIPLKEGGYRRGTSPTYSQLVRQIAGDASDDAALKNLEDFDKYLLGKSQLPLAADAAEVAAQVQRLEAQYPHFASVLPAYKKHTDELVDMLEGYGLIDKDAANSMKASEIYVPTGRSLTNPYAKPNPLRAKINTSSKQQIISPMKQIFEAERKAIQRGEINKLGNKILDELNSEKLAGSEKWKGRLEIADGASSSKPIEEAMAMLEESYKGAGLPVPTNKQLRAEAMLVADEVLDFSTNKLNVIRDGVPVDIKVSDPMVLEFYKSRQFVEPSMVGKAFKDAERTSTRFLFQPFRELSGKNALFDQVEAFMNTKWKEYFPGVDWVKGVAAQVKNDPRIQDLRAERGLIATRYADANIFESSANYEDFLKQATKEAGVKAHLTHPLKAMQELMGVMSSATRIGAGLKKLNATGDVGAAAQMARNVLADPQQRGTAQTIKLLANSSFANYGLQSTRRTLQAIQDNPGIFATKGAMTIALPSVGFWLLGKDDQEIQDLRKARGGDNFWYVRNPMSREIYALQKPYLPGHLFGTSVEAALDGMDPKVSKQFAKTLLDNVIPNPVPVTLGLGAELAFGKNWMGFFENPIPLAPQGAQGALAEDVGGNSTFGLSKLLAEKSGIEAAKIDNTLKTIMFSQASDLYDRLDRKIFDRPSAETKLSPINAIPILKKANPARSNVEPLNTFYENYGELVKVGKSFELAQGQGNVARLRMLVEQYPQEYARWQAYDAMNEIFGMINQQINITTNNKNLSSEDRRIKIDQLKKMMIEKARAWNAVNKM